MTYTKDKIFFDDEVILSAKQYKGYTMLLADDKSGGGWINGYVVIRQNQSGYNAHTINITCHGGITFDEFDTNKNRVIGFDTAHYYDFARINNHRVWKSNKWTTQRLFDECKNIINQLTEEA